MHRLVPLLLILLLAWPAQAQPAPPLTDEPLTDEAAVSLITILPGPSIEALFGHSALRVRDPAAGIDRLYNYGTFDFNDPFFVPKFLYGDLEYFLSVSSGRVLPRYADVQGRPVIEQHLDLGLEQRQAVFSFLENNARPENRAYRYDFYFDNCSTRILDVFEDTLQDAVDFGYAPGPTQDTFRDLLQPYIVGQRHVQTGMNVLLGTPSDAYATERERAFLPDYLLGLFDQATVVVEGQTQPLVARTDTVAWVEGYERATPGLPWMALLGWLVAFGAAWRTYREWRAPDVGGRRASRWLDAGLFGVAGVVGVALSFLWLISLHTVTHPNWNILWAWPTHAIVVFWLARCRVPAWLCTYVGVAAVVGLIGAIGWPLWPQELPTIALPLSLALSLRAGSHWYRSRRRQGPGSV